MPTTIVDSLAPPLGPTDEWAERLLGLIENRSRGQIRNLQVVCSAGAITLQGRSRTYHAKQLAQQAALDFTGGEPRLANLIEVC